MNSRAVKMPFTLLLVFAVFAVAGPWLSPYDYITTNFDRMLTSPSVFDMHLFGTDDLGRDLFVRTMLGMRVTLVGRCRRQPGQPRYRCGVWRDSRFRRRVGSMPQ